MDFTFTEKGLIVRQMKPASCLNMTIDSVGHNKDSFLLAKELAALIGELKQGKNEITFHVDGEEKAVTWNYAAKNSGFDPKAVTSNPDKLAVYMQIRKIDDNTYKVSAVGKSGIEAIVNEMRKSGNATPLQLDKLKPQDLKSLMIKKLVVEIYELKADTLKELASKIQELAQEGRDGYN